MPSVALPRHLQAFLAAILLIGFVLYPLPGEAQSLFVEHRVTVQLAMPDGKPMADSEVRVFAPGNLQKPVLTGHTDSGGKFEFEADRDGFWTAQAHAADGEIASVSVRVGGNQSVEPISPYFLLGGLVLLLAMAVGFRILRARTRRPSARP